MVVPTAVEAVLSSRSEIVTQLMYFFMRNLYPVLLVFIGVLSSCISHKDATNFQGQNFPPAVAKTYPNKRTPYRIQPNDVLSIRVKGIDKEAYDFMNLEPEGMFNAFNPAALFVNGYSVSDSGYVYLPVIGLLKVANLTLNETKALVQKAVDKQLKNTAVFISMVSFKVSIMGEVKNPGQYYNYNNQLTLLDALSLAGDVTDFGNRKNITLVRQNEQGNEVVRLNLTDPNIVMSKYYYLLPNDIIYVQPLKAKFGRQNAGNITIIASVVGAIASALAIIIAINNNSK